METLEEKRNFARRDAYDLIRVFETCNWVTKHDGRNFNVYSNGFRIGDSTSDVRGEGLSVQTMNLIKHRGYFSANAGERLVKFVNRHLWVRNSAGTVVREDLTLSPSDLHRGPHHVLQKLHQTEDRIDEHLGQFWAERTSIPQAMTFEGESLANEIGGGLAGLYEFDRRLPENKGAKWEHHRAAVRKVAPYQRTLRKSNVEGERKSTLTRYIILIDLTILRKDVTYYYRGLLSRIYEGTENNGKELSTNGQARGFLWSFTQEETWTRDGDPADTNKNPDMLYVMTADRELPSKVFVGKCLTMSESPARPVAYDVKIKWARELGSASEIRRYLMRAK